jgi:hypothetical protein
MRKARYFVFEPFRLDVVDERLWEPLRQGLPPARSGSLKALGDRARFANAP